MVSLIVLILTTEPDVENYGYSKKGEFAVGTEENIIIFITDTLQSDTMREYLASDAYPSGQLDNFTFFDNMVSGGSPTARGLPVLVTGVEYDPLQSEDEWIEERWDDVTLYDALHQKGYDIRFYSDYSIAGISDKIIDNYTSESKYIEDYFAFTKQLYKLVSFYLAPQVIKERFWLSTENIVDTISTDKDNYKLGNFHFYDDMKANGPLQMDYEKTFRLYHLSGVHPPYCINENLEQVEPDSVTEQQALQGVMKIIYQYIDDMKSAGIYDASTIIITGDHGRYTEGNPSSNPAFLIKRPYDMSELVCNSVPVHFRNVIATIAETIMNDYSFYGPSVYDITVSSDVERLHTMANLVRNKNWIDNEWDKTEKCRVIVPNDPEDIQKYKIWDPYTLNSVNYKLGEEIDFTTDDAYAKQVNYRLYKENGMSIASNELSICFNIQDIGDGDLTLHYTYAFVYNDKQTMRIYENGSKVDTVICAKENIHKDNTIMIPRDKINEHELILRFVFPNAVTPNQLDRENKDTRILSIALESMWLDNK